MTNYVTKHRIVCKDKLKAGCTQIVSEAGNEKIHMNYILARLEENDA